VLERGGGFIVSMPPAQADVPRNDRGLPTPDASRLSPKLIRCSAMGERLVVICGNAGTGKTSWAAQLARRGQASLLDLDTVSERLVAAAQAELGRDPNDRDSVDYKRVFREAVHETLFAIARECGGPVIIVAPFTRERVRPDFRAWLQGRCGRAAEVHYFTCDPAVREARLRARNHPRDRGKFLDYAAYNQLGAVETPPSYEHVWFDTSQSFPESD
jgi:predicted kinase